MLIQSQSLKTTKIIIIIL